MRASTLAADSATGYFCGVDLRGGRLLLGRMSGAYSATHGVFTILGESAMTVSLNTPYVVQAEAQGSTITCTPGAQQIIRTDATITTGPWACSPWARGRASQTRCTASRDDPGVKAARPAAGLRRGPTLRPQTTDGRARSGARRAR